MSRTRCLTHQSTQQFEEMKLTRFKWLMMMGCCFNTENSLKKAVKLHAVTGIIVAVITLLLGGVGNLLVFLMSGYQELRMICLGSAYTYIVIGFIIIVYNSILLAKNDRPEAVFEMIKVGCLVLASFALILELILIISIVIAAYNQAWDFLIGLCLLYLLGLSSILVLYGIVSEKLKFVSVFVNIYLIVFLLLVFTVPLVAVIYNNTNTVLVILTLVDLILEIAIGLHILDVFVIQLNVMCAKSANVPSLPTSSQDPRFA